MRERRWPRMLRRTSRPQDRSSEASLWGCMRPDAIVVELCRSQKAARRAQRTSAPAAWPFEHCACDAAQHALDAARVRISAHHEQVGAQSFAFASSVAPAPRPTLRCIEEKLARTPCNSRYAKTRSRRALRRRDDADAHDLDEARSLEDRQRIGEGACRFAAVVPRDEHVLAEGLDRPSERGTTITAGRPLAITTSSTKCLATKAAGSSGSFWPSTRTSAWRACRIAVSSAAPTGARHSALPPAPGFADGLKPRWRIRCGTTTNAGASRRHRAVDAFDTAARLIKWLK